MDSQEQEIDRVFELVCDLAPEERGQRLDVLGLAPEVRAQVERLLSHYDEPRRDLERWSPSLDGSESLERIDRYLVQRRLGEGGMGIVYLARREDTDESIALKVMRTSWANEHQLHRFRREAEVLSRLDHAGICRFIEAGDGGSDDSPLPYIAMEFVNGEPLLDAARHRGLEDTQRIELIARVCEALHHAHQAGVIHRDLKPNNILVEPASETDPIGQPKLLDFGVARARGDDLATLTQTHTGALVGTVAYMSPEQVSGSTREIDARSDVYSLGVLLFELLSGRLPYPIAGQPVPLMARIIQEAEPSRLSTDRSNKTDPLEHILAKTLEKEPRRRYSTAQALGEDLRRYARGEPVHARATTLPTQVRKFARRHRVLTATALGTLAALLVGLVTTIWFAMGQARARADSDTHAAEADRNAYGMALRAAVFALRLGDVGAVRASLDAASPEHRHWEWRQLEAALDESLLTLPGAGSETIDSQRLQFDEDGQHIHVWNDLEFATVDLSTGRVVERLTHELSLSGDVPSFGRLTANGVVQAKSPSGVVLEAVTPPIPLHHFFALMSSPYAIIAGDDEQAYFFDPVHDRLRPLGNGPHWGLAQLSASRRWLAVPSSGGYSLWDLETQASPFVYSSGAWRANRLAFSPKSDRVAYADADGRISQWSLEPGREPRLDLQVHVHQRPARALAYSPDSRLLASAVNQLTLSHAASGNRIRSLLGNERPVTCIAFSPDSKRIASVDDLGTLAVWDIERSDPRILDTGSAYAYAASFDPAGSRFYAGTPAGELLVGDTDSASWFARIPLSVPQGRTFPKFHVNDLALDLNHDRLVVASNFGELRVLSRTTGVLEKEFFIENGALHADFHPDGSRLALAGDSGRVRIYATAGWTVVAEGEFEAGLDALHYTPNGEWIVIGAREGVCHVLDAESLEIRTTLDGMEGRTRALTFHEERGWMVTGGVSQIRVIDLDTLEEIARVQLLDWVTCAAFSPDGERLMAGSYDTNVYVVDTSSWSLVTPLEGHTGYVFAADFHPGGETLITTGGDGQVRLWDTRSIRDVYVAQDEYDAIAQRLAPVIEEHASETPEAAAEALRRREGWSAREREIALQLLLRALHGTQSE